MKSILGRLMQEEFGSKQYDFYINKLKKKESMDIFCDIYMNLRTQTEEQLNQALVKLLDCIQNSIRISKNFIYITLVYLATALILFVMPQSVYVRAAGVAIMTSAYIFKLLEYLKNRYCNRDVRIVLIYKIALFHLLEEAGKEKK